ncbi:site-specific integrase [Paraglaciecola arctica]|uniref:site-specific integrase n=1 Tax=Paraglaciecola arctica TaxID=1128911 RepID=UPI001C0787C2|nr:site-specific integrase [Paraglaciecola arctica]MBU3005934.1 site-specific integrase [Paraglaciecola arctica]
MSVTEVKSGYLIKFFLHNERYTETIPALHNKTTKKRISEQETIYKTAISISDKSSLDKYPNSKILQKAFKCESDAFTIDDYSSIWFQQKQRNWSHTTIRGYSQKYNSYIKPNFGHMRLKDFKASMFDEWASKQTLSGKSINEARNVIHQIFKRAFFDGVIDSNTAERIERYKQDQKEPEPFTKVEIAKILDALETPYREFFQFAIWTGLRTGELLALRWQDVDLDKGVAHIRKNITLNKEKEPKTKGSIRTIEMQFEAIQALKSIINSKYCDEYRVFIDPKTNTTYKYADGLRKYVWKPTLNKIGVKYRYPYQCRHTFASMMLTSGKNPMWVASQMGHADWGMIRKTYGRWIPESSQNKISQ